jgi:hypothetical protein
MTDRGWSKGRPALGEILVRLLSLRARMDRLEAARRMSAIAKTVRLLKE